MNCNKICTFIYFVLVSIRVTKAFKHVLLSFMITTYFMKLNIKLAILIIFILWVKVAYFAFIQQLHINAINNV